MNAPQPIPAALKHQHPIVRAARAPWEIETIQKLSFGLSETIPILEFQGLYRTPVGSHYDMHFGLEFGVIVSGRMRRYYRSHWRDVGPGQVWFCGMWEPHGFKVLKAPCKTTVFVIWPPMLANLRFEETPDTSWLAPFLMPPGQRPQVAARMKARMLEAQRRSPEVLATQSAGRQLWLRLLFLEMLLILYEQGSFRKAPRNTLAPDFFLRINQALQQVFESRALVTTAQAARTCGMSRETFSNLFTRWMGIRFSEFSLRYRVNAAAIQVAHTNVPIKSIALHWGFTDSSHLHCCFQKYYHCTPGEYRQRRLRRSGTARRRHGRQLISART